MSRARPGGYRRGMTEFVRAAAVGDIPNGRGKLWRHADKRIALIRTDSGVFAADNRCPHEGYALVQGDVSGDVLTCAWHNWKFRLADGEYLFGGENIRTYPVEVRDGYVFVDVTDPAPETIAPQLFASLLAAMGDVDVGRMARDTMRLRKIGTPLAEVVREGVRFGATRAEYGWNHSLATLADCLTMAAAFEGPLRAQGGRRAGGDPARLPVRHHRSLPRLRAPDDLLPKGIRPAGSHRLGGGGDRARACAAGPVRR
jgi:nitrite reductase/ring-hydroxylating ferredoxin subunit